MLDEARAETRRAAQLEVRDTAEVAVELIERAERLHERGGGAMADAGDARYVVDLVAGERQVVGEAFGSDAEVPFDVVVAELPAGAEIPEQVAVAHELREILVAGDVGRAHAVGAHERGERADDVVRLVLGIDEHGESEVPAQLAAALELQRQIGRGTLAIGLVRRIDAVAVGAGAALIEGDRHVARAHALDEIPEEARKAEHGVHRVAVAVAHVRQHGVIGTKDVDRGVDQEYQGAACFR